MIQILPAIDIIEGRCVRLTRGDYAQKKVYDASPVDMAARYADCGVTRIHLVDLDGARLSSPANLAVLEQIASRAKVETEWGGGIADEQALKSVFDAGATKAIIGSVAALKPECFSDWLLKFGSGRLILGADVRDGKVAAILISAPTQVPGGKVKVPSAMQESSYQAVTLDGTSETAFRGETMELPAFEGMLMLISTREKAKTL